ncbi:MAG: hypothetical protein IAI49_01610 [Candidatus Eremiobacteraeota bacterium]|nr:hypothetical protein [Candidatus Eremiobacteraeota bacterium]
MNDRTDTTRTDADGALEDAVSEHEQTLGDTFGLSPETARAAAEDTLSSGMRNPASDAVEAERIAAAQAEAQK